MSIANRVRIVSVETLSKNWATLKKTTLDFRRANGEWQRQVRETYDRGNGATILLYNLKKRTVILTRQFRYAAFAAGHDDFLIEAAAGLLDSASPEERIRKEAEEETGYRVKAPKKLFEIFMTPGSVMERLNFFTAPYEPGDRISKGGGIEAEGEEIETLELGIDEALAMVADGRILDAKTIILLQHAKLAIFP